MKVSVTEVDTILAAAIELSLPQQRADYVQRVCGENAELRRRVEELLDAHFAAGDFLEQPPATVFLRDGEDVQAGPGTVIGPYKLLQQIGEGGMGMVFMAEQTEPIHRTVALKIIKPGMDTRQVIARFEAERQALAMMDHPSIAKVLDAGTTETGRPYFVMELVKGVPITKYCDEHKLSIRDRLELVRPMCEAVQHAHQKGIIHRDLKPSNVLIAEYDSHAVPKIIDFGVAKATAQRLTERTMFTEFGQVIGTVEYMSPEQAKFNQLDIDTRSDIYSLGVLLYELLTGSTPFERERLRSAAFDEVLRIIREEEPPRPSTRLSTSTTLPSIAANRHSEPEKLSRNVSGELDWIVMKCLEKDRNRRYETANGLLRDIERYLNDEPVQACPPSAAYRFRKFARRNKAALMAGIAALVVLLTLVVGLAISNRLIDAQRAQADVERQRAEENLLRARVAVRDILFDAALARGEWGHLPESLRTKFAENTTTFYSSFLKEDSANPSLQYETAIGFRSLANLHISLNNLTKAEEFARQAIAVLDRITRDFPENFQYRNQHAYAYSVLGSALNRLGRKDAAKEALSKSFEIYAALVAESPDNINVRNEMTNCFLALVPRCDAEESERLTKRQIELNATHPDLKGDRAELVESYRALATKLSTARQWNAAFSVASFGVQAAERFVRDAPQSADAHNGLALCLRTRGSVQRGLGHDEESERDFNQAVEIFTKLRAEHPDAAKYKTQLANCFRGLGLLKQQQSKLKESESYYRQAIEANPDDADAMNGLGNALWADKRLAEAASIYREALKRAPDNFGCRLNLASVLQDQRKYSEAEPEYREVLRHAPRDSAAIEGLGVVLRRQDKLNELTDLYQQRLKANPNDAALRVELATIYQAVGRTAESDAEWRKALELPKAKNAGWLNYRSWDLATAADPKWRDAPRAVMLAERATELAPQDGNIWNTLGVARYRAGSWQAAVDAFTKSTELRNGGDAADQLFLAMAHWQLDHKADALQWHEKAIQSTSRLVTGRELLGIRAEAAELLKPAYDEDVAQARSAIEREPSKGAHYNKLGAALEKQGKHHAARAAYRKSIELSPELTAAYVSLVRVSTVQGDYEEAGATLREFLKNTRKLDLLATERVLNKDSGHEYQRIEVPMTWHQARDCCALLGGHLATVESAAENEFLYNQFAREYVCWLGASDAEYDGEWKWVTGEPWKYQNWFDGEPNNVGASESFLVFGDTSPVVVNGVPHYFNFGSRWCDFIASGVYHGVAIAHPICEWDERDSKPRDLSPGAAVTQP